MSQITPGVLLEQLFDEQEFTEIQKYPGSGVVAGMGKIAGFSVYAYVQDINVKSGAVNQNAAAKMKKIYASAVKCGAPVVAVFNSKGGDIGEGTQLIDAYSEMIENAARLSGVVPLISVVTGQCSGLNATLARMSDFVIMTESAAMFFTPPFIAEERVENAGNAQFNAESGVADVIVKDEFDAVLKAREILLLLPSNNLEPAFNSGELEPNNADITAELKSTELLTALAGIDSLIEINGCFGSSAITALGSLNYYQTVGFVAFDKPEEKLTSADAAKIARFVNFCDAFSIPVITIIDNEGFEPSQKAESAGLIRDTAKLAQIYASATTPKISLITGKATGAAFILAGGFKSDFVIAYENAVVSPVPIKTAATFLGQSQDDYIENHASVENALKKGYVDLVISPSEARNALIKAVDAVRDKRVSVPSRKHINLIF